MMDRRHLMMNVRDGGVGAAKVAWSFAWSSSCLVLFATLGLIEPLLRYTLCPIAFLGVAVTLLFGFLLNEPGFPKWAMLAFSVGALLMYWLYLAVLFSLERLLSK